MPNLGRVLLPLLLVGCSALPSTPPQLIPPEVSVREIGGIRDGAAQHVEGGIVVNLQVLIINRSAESLTVERIDVLSKGAGAFTIPRASRPFDRELRQDTPEALDLWVPAIAEESILGVSGPVTLQLTVYYRSPFGKFREIYVRNINTSQVRERRE